MMWQQQQVHQLVATGVNVTLCNVTQTSHVNRVFTM